MVNQIFVLVFVCHTSSYLSVFHYLCRHVKNHHDGDVWRYACRMFSSSVETKYYSTPLLKILCWRCVLWCKAASHAVMGLAGKVCLLDFPLRDRTIVNKNWHNNFDRMIRPRLCFLVCVFWMVHCLTFPDRCNSEQFPCANGLCLHQSLQCNGADNCGDNSDEQGCGKVYPIN